MTTTTEAIKSVHDYFHDQWNVTSQYTANRRCFESAWSGAAANVRQGIECLIEGHIDEPGTIGYRDLTGDWHVIPCGIRCQSCDRLTLTNGTQLIPGAQS